MSKFSINLRAIKLDQIKKIPKDWYCGIQSTSIFLKGNFNETY